MMRLSVGTAVAALLLALTEPGAADDFCPAIYPKAVLNLPFNPAFLHVQRFRTAGGYQDGLLMSSFYNVIKTADGTQVDSFFERDLVAAIRNLDAVGSEGFRLEEALEIVSDIDGVSRQVWPNETSLVPPGVLDFEAVISPQGFQVAPKPGRLSLINLDDPDRADYVIDQSSFNPPRCELGSEDNQPWFYHDVRFHDMDDDGLKDVITARSSFRIAGGMCPPAGQLVWFKNPGAAIARDKEWEETILVDMNPAPGGPEVNMTLADIDRDGVPEIIATHFFKHDGITIYGPPAGKRWADVNIAEGVAVRQLDIMTNKGRPFAVEVVDLNGDDRLDVLTSNHQGDGCFDVTDDEIPGRVIAIEQPSEGGIFDGPWTVRVIKDDIRPNPTYPAPARGPGRLAPNRALAFWPERKLETQQRPWVLVGGDEASKVWVLQPQSQDQDDWRYESAVVFDINVYYGPRASQTLLEDPLGVSISTIGGLSWRYDDAGFAEIYFPVFEAQDIHVMSFRPQAGERAVACTPDVQLSCPITTSRAD